MKNILIATDFQESSKPALETAVLLSQKTESTLHILHTYLPVYPMTETISSPPVTLEWEDTIRQNAQLQMDAIRNTVEAMGVQAVVHLELGSTTVVVKELIQTHGIDLVVVGRSESDGWFFNFFGNTATQLTNELTVPLLMVPSTVPSAEITTIAYATQLEFEEVHVLKDLYEWADAIGAHVQLIHVQAEHEPSINPNDELLAEIRQAFPDRHTTVLERKADSVEEGINELLADTAADLVVMSSHHRNLFTQIINPSDSKSALLHSPIAVLVFPLGEV